MKHADILIIDAWVLTMDAQRREFNPGYLAINGSKILAAGPMAEAVAWTATRTLDARGGIVLPGLVNTHTHAAMTCFRGMADDLPVGMMVTGRLYDDATVIQVADAFEHIGDWRDM